MVYYESAHTARRFFCTLTQRCEERGRLAKNRLSRELRTSVRYARYVGSIMIDVLRRCAVYSAGTVQRRVWVASIALESPPKRESPFSTPLMYYRSRLGRASQDLRHVRHRPVETKLKRKSGVSSRRLSDRSRIARDNLTEEEKNI